MKKTSLILKHFQKKGLLTVKNQDYAKTVSDLFRWLTENDQVQSDQTTSFFPSKKATAKIISHQKAVLAGIEEISFLLKNHTSLIFKPFKKDGEKIKKGQSLAEISGNTHEILAYERTILNILQRFSGIATGTNNLVNQIKSSPSSLVPSPFLASTRKTPWGLLDKKAVSLGGGLTHRLSLADEILIKDNHLAFCPQALSVTLSQVKNRLVEIEVKTEKEAFIAVETFQKLGGNNHLAILFDNFSPNRLSSLLSDLSSLSNLSDSSSIIFEASGGITKDNILSYAQTGVDIISVGSLTHSCQAANFSLEIS